MAIAPKDASREYQRTVLAHRATLDRLLDRRSVLGMKRYFDQAQDRLERALARGSSGSRNAPISPLQAQQLLVQVRQAQQALARRLAQALLPTLYEAQIEGVDQTDQVLTKSEDDFVGGYVTLPLSEPSTKAKLAERRSSALGAANDSAWLKFGAAMALSLQRSAAISLALEEPHQDAVERMRAAADAEWWRGERIIHTEMAYAYNQAKADSIAEVAGAIAGLGKRWCELVDDATGLPMDARVGNDSLVLHGQVVESTGLFVMPPDPTVHPSFWNKSWNASPNRPNDRSVTMPWRQAWGVPGWRWLNGQRVPVNRQG